MFQFATEFCRRWILRFATIGVFTSGLSAQAGFWTTGYYPGYEQNGSMPASDIDFSALTHVIHFSIVPNADGTLNSSNNFITWSNSTNLVALAHAAGVKVLISVGGGDSEPAFKSATSEPNLPAFINNLTNFVASRGYDGVDIDWEPCPSTDFPLYTNLLTGLRSSLNHLGKPELLTVAAAAYPPYGDSLTAEYSMFASLQTQLDQINIMTYDLCGPYDGWVTWFNSPIYDGGYRLPSSGNLMPSINGAVQNFITNGVTPGKLAVATAFYGCVWTGSVSQPRQSWTKAPTSIATRYTDIIANYYATNSYQWDVTAQAAYLSITNANSTNGIFISYDDEHACLAKVNYARNKGLGGIAIWELGQDHTPNTPDPLLQAMKQAVNMTHAMNLPHTRNDVNLAGHD